MVWEQITGKHWREIQGDAIESALQAIRDDEKFWLELPTTANAKNLLSLIKQVKGKYKILSALSRRQKSNTIKKNG